MINLIMIKITMMTISKHHGAEPFSRGNQNFPAFYGTRRFIAVFTRNNYPSLSSARPIQSI
jgi:hypothetical protein